MNHSYRPSLASTIMHLDNDTCYRDRYDVLCKLTQDNQPHAVLPSYRQFIGDVARTHIKKPILHEDFSERTREVFTARVHALQAGFTEQVQSQPRATRER